MLTVFCWCIESDDCKSATVQCIIFLYRFPIKRPVSWDSFESCFSPRWCHSRASIPLLESWWKRTWPTPKAHQSSIVIKYSITQLFYTSRDARCCSLKLERVSFLLWWGSGKQSLGRRKYAKCLNQFKWDDLRWSIRKCFLDPKTLVFGVIRTWATWISLQPRCYVLRSWEMPCRCRDKSQRLEPRKSWMDLAHFCI